MHPQMHCNKEEKEINNFNIMKKEKEIRHRGENAHPQMC
jgi:hypothetical protein